MKWDPFGNKRFEREVAECNGDYRKLRALSQKYADKAERSWRIAMFFWALTALIPLVGVLVMLVVVPWPR